ncbi:T9SS type A sorting domain-containing protein [Flavobacterium columnare]|uniref:T9SS C-terminal target domain-containing protein n=1 Tax=Flavobacterium columnare TaxID=996 RepID=A0AA94EX60_9FLAO|nr:T9SS type A sorting domain-containing protein [Flavobacterium columnare]MCH4829457.1 T9SS type A sorting domain-containing protein [Flavobacterium columnare]MCH4831549.1 T9SS type A sorting domain-containing protein [Flavobacterium columnare]
MKKITSGIFCFFMYVQSQANIIVRDIADFTFTPDVSLDIDFNNDAIPEFSFQEMGGSVGSLFNPADVNFIVTGTLATGHGWDIIKSLALGSTISNSSSFDAQGDAYINPNWANPNEKFPIGDSYIGCFFKISGVKYYGWLLVNSTANGVITLKSYAYNNVPGQSINVGETLGTENFKSISVSHYPNPAQTNVFVDTTEKIKKVISYDINGRTLELPYSFSSIDISKLEEGHYFLDVFFENDKRSIMKIIKN